MSSRGIQMIRWMLYVQVACVVSIVLLMMWWFITGRENALTVVALVVIFLSVQLNRTIALARGYDVLGEHQEGREK